MKAWRFYGFNDLRLDDIPKPTLTSGHVIAEVLCVQPSVTEAQLANNIPTVAYDAVKKRLETDAPVQLFGHEFCLRIVESADDSPFRPGDRVAARAKLPCGDCSMCLSEQSARCRKGPIIGFQLPGAFAEFASIPEIALVKLDDRISDSEAACIQSLSDSLAGVDTADVQLGDSVAIIGQGSMGLETMQVARANGAGKIITVDVRAESCEISKQLGADHPINASETDAAEAIRDLTGGSGADIVFECAGGSPRQGLSGSKTFDLALEAVRSGGKLMVVSFYGKPLEIAIDRLRERSLRLLFPDISTLAHLEQSVLLVATGRVRLKPAITHVLQGIEAVPEAFEITANKGKYGAVNPAQVMIAGTAPG